MRPRLLLRFSAAGGGLAVEFPPAAYEWESSQSLRGATEPAVGADYAVDLLERRPAPKAVATERVRGIVVARDGAALDVEMDRLRSRLYRIGRGKLWAVGDEDAPNLLDERSATLDYDLDVVQPVNAVTLVRDFAQRAEGAASIRVMTPGAVAQEGLSTLRGTAGVPVIPGEPYTFSAAVRGSTTLSLRLWWYTAAGALITAHAAAVTATQSWQRAHVTATAPAGAVTVAGAVLTDGTSATTFWVDALQIERGAPTPFRVRRERWAWARLDSMPDITLTVAHRRHAPVILSFLRLSDWYAAEPVVIQQRVTSPTLNLAITNPGEATARQITVTLRSRKSSGFSAPTITNELTGETCGTSRVAGGATHVWRLDAGRLAVEYSTDDGTTWTSDYANLITGPLQVGFLRVEPGTNPLTITSQGSPDYDLEIAFYPAWH